MRSPEASSRAERQARRLLRVKARSFYLASLFLPASIRRDVQIVYGFYRTIDDLVDIPPPGSTREDILEALAAWDRALLGLGPYPEPVGDALVRVTQRHEIPPAYLRMIVDGARLDLDLRWIETRDELTQYSMLVAGSVGIVMAHILGTPTEDALEAAKSLGVAMQLTNVLRDVGEDLDRGRIYLPRAELERADGALEGLRNRSMTAGLRAVMRDLAGYAREHYRRGLSGIPHLEPTARFAVVLAASLYSRILDKIEEQQLDVFQCRAHLTARERWTLAVPVYLRYRDSHRRAS